MSDGAFPDRLTQLRNRWESDPTSRIFLQLAEEYRHQGRVKEALEVLERGLKEHPGYLSALVAKGRCLLELGEPEEARTVLERVVKQDATQMVANKLLVRACLETGDPEKARERLDLYSLLNDSDPEIEELRRRIRSMEQPPEAQRPDPAPGLAAPFPDLAPPPGGDLFDLGAPTGPRLEVQDVFELDVAAPPPPPPPPPAPALSAAAPAPQATPGDVFDLPMPAFEAAGPAEGDVFADLFAAPVNAERHLSALASEGLFFFETPAPPPSPVAAPVPPPPAPEPAPEPAPFAWAFERAAAAPAEEPRGEEPVFLPEEEPEPVFAAPEPPVFEIEEPTPWEAEPEPLLVEPEPVPVPEPEPVATLTLGELYLRQGHREEAERIFREVLRREPENAQANDALARLAPPPPAPPAPVVEPVEELGHIPAAITGSNARKAYVLRKYLERIRQGSQRHVS